MAGALLSLCLMTAGSGTEICFEFSLSARQASGVGGRACCSVVG